MVASQEVTDEQLNSIYWVVVEEATPTRNDDVTDSDLTSPIWVDVEEYMGLEHSSPDTSSDDDFRVKQPLKLIIEELPHETQTQIQQHQPPPPPLPTSPPPSSSSPGNHQDHSSSTVTQKTNEDQHQIDDVSLKTCCCFFYTTRIIKLIIFFLDAMGNARNFGQWDRKGRDTTQERHEYGLYIGLIAGI